MSPNPGIARFSAAHAREAEYGAHDYRFTGGETDRGSRASAEPILEIAAVLARANFHCLVGGLRLGYRASRRLCQGHLRLLGHVVQPDPSRDRPHMLGVIVDETRSCLREVADISSQEFRRLQGELEGLQEATRAVISDPAKPAKYGRHWKVKG